ncbi:PilN family type IVB pilus formation outer membrane protein [Pantoea agglomerans]|uniref:PilN family type IVB pilus formation outer membrane protein n=1 Tax=Enterobacter agglomerans TaxID=549 RepID=UPI0028935CC8|nr:PilN family type IVB pilus formation outer membrane protein [Pantoea agglomerans]WNK30376.1 PilN family type IVB pilus formation outer membrane protein [Pantoea agglomerans]WNK34982.1 PilN family type IVB pilus formation outer membrane protein [Pantoea agglomerans]
MSRTPLKLTLLAMAVLLSACSVKDVSTIEKENNAQADTAQRVLKSRLDISQPAVVWSDKPWVNLRPIQPVISAPDSVKLPPCQVVLNNPEGLTLAQIASRINTICDFRVFISPEVAAALMRSAVGGVATSQMSGRLPAPDDNGRVPLAQMGMQQAQTTTVSAEPLLFQGTRFLGDAQEALNIAASTLGLSVRRSVGRVDFYIQDTRTFQLAILNTKVNSTASITSGAGTQLGSEGGTGGTKGDVSSNQKTDYGMNSDLYNDIRKTVEQILTPKSGRYWLSDATGTLSVTDTPEVLDRVGRYIDYQNKVLSRQVQLNVQIVRVTQTSNVDRGLDWGLIVKSVTGFGATLGSTFAGAPTNAGSAGISILDTASGGAAKFSGSQLMLRALAQQGTVTMALNQTDPTANLTPVAYQLSKSTGLLTSSNSTAVANVGVTSSQTVTSITTGLFMTMLPFVQENGDIQLQFAFSYTTPPDVKSFISKDGNTRNDVANTATEGLARKVNLRAGQTLVLTGSEQQNASSDKQGTFTPDNFILGGGQSGAKSRSTLVIMVTPDLLGQ